MFWNQYPYINLNDLNLDFLLKAIGEMQNEVENFVTLNAVKYADPIQWNITRQYQKNTIVIDPLTGTAYISTKPVPSGVALNDANYWTPVFDLSMFVTQANENLTEHVEGAGVVYSTFPLNENDWVVWNGILYKALVNMPIGTAYSINGNIERVTVEDYIKSIVTAINNEIQARIDGDDALNNKIGNLADLTTTDKTSIVNAINEIISDIGNLNPSQAVLVEYYGAVGDGIEDDTQAIQNAIDNADIVILNNDYKITSSLNLRPNVKLIGNGNIIVDGVFDVIIMNNDCSVVGLSFTDTNNTYIDDNIVIYGNEVENVSVIGCKFVNIHLGYCVRFDKSEHINIKHNFINEYSYSGIMLINGCYYADIEFNKIVNARSSNANRYPISFSGYFTIADRSAKYIKCNYNEIIDDASIWEGIDSHSSEFVEIIGNYISGTRYGIAFGSPSTPTLASGQSARNITIKDNIIFPIVGDGISYGIMFTINERGIGTIFNVDISNNKIVLTGTPSVYSDIVSAITLRSNANCVDIYNNDIEGSFNGVALAAGQFQNISINKNRFRNVTGANFAAVNLHYEAANVINDSIDVSDNTMSNCTNDFIGPATVTRGLIAYNNNSDAQHYADIDYTTAPRSTAPSTATKSQGKTGDFIPCTATGTIAGWLCNSATHWVEVAGTVI